MITVVRWRVPSSSESFPRTSTCTGSFSARARHVVVGCRRSVLRLKLPPGPEREPSTSVSLPALTPTRIEVTSYHPSRVKVTARLSLSLYPPSNFSRRRPSSGRCQPRAAPSSRRRCSAPGSTDPTRAPVTEGGLPARGHHVVPCRRAVAVVGDSSKFEHMLADLQQVVGHHSQREPGCRDRYRQPARPPGHPGEPPCSERRLRRLIRSIPWIRFADIEPPLQLSCRAASSTRETWLAEFARLLSLSSPRREVDVPRIVRRFYLPRPSTRTSRPDVDLPARPLSQLASGFLRQTWTHRAAE